MTAKIQKIADINPVIQYIANGNLTSFDYPYMLFSDDEMLVYWNDELLTSGYTITQSATGHGGTVVFDSAPADGTLVTLKRNCSYILFASWPDGGDLRPQVLNRELNHIIALTQQNKATMKLSLVLPDYVQGVDTELPAPAPGKTIVWSSDGKKLENSKDTVNTIITDATAQAENAANSAKAAENSAKQADKTAKDFDAHALAKTESFDMNAAAKQQSVNEKAAAAATSAANAASSAQAAKSAEERAIIIAEGSEDEIATLNNTLTRSAMDWALLAAHNSAGIVPDNCKKMRFKRNGSNVSLSWKDPDDTIVEGQVICTWHATYIVRKLGAYPENPQDGEVVLVNTQKNLYEDTPLTLVEPEADDEYFYSAFPASSEGAKNLSPRNRFGVWVYGWVINEDDPVEETAVQYMDEADNRFYEHCYMDFANDKFEFGDWKIDELLPKPCMLKFDGTVDYYLDENDYTKKADGTASDIANVNYGGNAMAEFPRVFRKKWRSRNKQYCLFSNIKLDEGFDCLPCKNSDGSYTESFFGPMFEGTKDSAGRMRSIVTGTKALNNTTAEAEMAAARLNGPGHDITNWAAEDYWRDLGILLFKRLNIQAALGFGATASSQNLTVNTGCSVSKPGPFWGSKDASANGMKMFCMENFYGHRWRRFVGCLLINGVFHVKMTKSQIDGSTTDDYNLTGDGYINTGITAPAASQSYIKKLAAGKYGGLPVEVGGSSTTYYCDGMWSDLSGVRMPLSGGQVANGVLGGLFSFNVHIVPSYSNWYSGGSLFFKKPL